MLVLCDCLNMMPIDCMLARRCEKFKLAKMADSSNYVVYVLYLLTGSYCCIICIWFYLCYQLW